MHRVARSHSKFEPISNVRRPFEFRNRFLPFLAHRMGLAYTPHSIPFQPSARLHLHIDIQRYWEKSTTLTTPLHALARVRAVRACARARVYCARAYAPERACALTNSLRCVARPLGRVRARASARYKLLHFICAICQRAAGAVAARCGAKNSSEQGGKENPNYRELPACAHRGARDADATAAAIAGPSSNSPTMR